jgi:hypothetical protein
MPSLAYHRCFLARAVAAAGVILTAGLALPGQAHAAGAPYCAFDNQTGFENCNYGSFEGCTWEMRAQGGYCYRNPDACRAPTRGRRGVSIAIERCDGTGLSRTAAERKKGDLAAAPSFYATREEPLRVRPQSRRPA